VALHFGVLQNTNVRRELAFWKRDFAIAAFPD
jgi:hypothetical protein